MVTAATWSGNIRRAYLLRILLAGDALCIPILALFWRSVGMSTTEIFFVQVVFHAALAAFEIPTGRFADRTGRKPSIVMGILATAIGFTLYPFVMNVAEMIVVELILALGASLVSGSLAALQYDSVLALGTHGNDMRVLGNSATCFYLGSVVFTIVGGLLASFELRMPLAAAAVPMWIGLAVASTLTEAPYHGGKKDVPVDFVLREHFARDGRIRWIVLFSAFVTAGLTAGLWLYQDCFLASGLPVWCFGLCFAGFNLVAATASRFARGCTWEGEAIFILPLMCVFGYAALALPASSWSFSFILIHQAVRGCNDVALEVRLNRSIGSNARATMLSVKSLCSSGMFVGIGMSAGVLGDHFGLSAAFGGLAAICAAGTMTFWWFRPLHEVVDLEIAVIGSVEVTA